MKSLFLSSIAYFFTFSSLHAQIILDGALGKSGPLQGPDYQIGADLGQQVGGNLFHSFRDFNLQSQETAIFSGPDTVQNVISRVTGGNPSSIDGTIRSTIPNADLYLLNPYGILFGPNAKLDVQGGFHTSTADYLRLSDGGRFDARVPSNSLLTVAPVAAFGFLADSPATITTQDSTLMVPPLKPLSLIGGNLHLQGTLPIQFDDLNIYATSATSLLKTTGGTLRLAALGSPGEVLVANSDLSLTGRGGEIRLDRTLADTSGLGSGNLKVRGSRLVMQDSTLQTNTLGEIDGSLMDIRLTESLHATSTPYYFFAFVSKGLLGQGDAGSITIKVPELTLDRVLLGTNSMTEGNSGNIDLEVTRLNLLTGAGLTPSAMNHGNSGENGQVTIKASESILISGQGIGKHSVNGITFMDYPSYIENFSFPSENEKIETGDINLITSRLDLASSCIATSSLGQGKSGNINIQADTVNLTDGGFITSSTFSTGAGGNLRLTVTDTLSLSGRRSGDIIIPVTGLRLENQPSFIYSGAINQGQGGEINVTTRQLDLAGSYIAASGLGQGKAGNVNIQAGNVSLSKGGWIASSALSTGLAGNIQLVVKDTLSLSGRYEGVYIVPVVGLRAENMPSYIASDTAGQGQGGDIDIITQQFDLAGGILSTANFGQSKGGNIVIQADNINITGGGLISSGTTGTGPAGNIQLTVKDTLSLSGRRQGDHIVPATGSRLENWPSYIDSSTYNQGQGGYIFLQVDSLDMNSGAVISTRSYGRGDAGKIELQAHQLHLVQHSSISTAATQAGGGNIDLIGLSDLLYLDEGEITTSVTTGERSSGDITIEQPQFAVLNQGLIRAQADAGNGGDITIRANQLIASPDSVVSASSNKGIAGNIMINSPESDISGMLTVLSGNFMNVANQFVRCSSLYEEESSRFSVIHLRGRPPEPGDWQ